MKLHQRILATCLSALLVFQGFGFALPAYAASDDSAVSIVEQSVESSGGTASDDNAPDTDSSVIDSSLEGKSSESVVSAETVTETAVETQSADDAEDEIAVVDDTATVTDTYSTVEALNTALNGHGSANGIGSNMVITFDDNDALKIVSHADAALYQYATMKKGGTTGGSFSVASADGEAATFEGFGSSDYPFAGNIVDDKGNPIEIATDRTFYNSLKVGTDNGTVNLKWVGETSYSDPMVAAELSGVGTLDVTINIADPTDATDITESSAAISAPLFGTSTATVTVNTGYSFSGTRKGMAISASGNIGLLVNTVSSGSFTIGSVTGLDSVSGDGSISTSNGNAGLFVGQVDDGATVSLGKYKLPINVTVSSTSGCAGGLAGLVGSGCTLTLTGAVNFSNLTAQGTTASGGLIGKATKLTLTQESGATFTCPTNVGSTDSQNTGGFIGSVSFADAKSFTANNEVVTASAVQLKGNTNAGSVFGYLDIANGNVTFEGATDGTTTFKSALAEAGGSVVYGGIVGRVEDTSASKIDGYYASTRTLTMNNVRVEGTCTKQAKTAGGLVGSLGSNANNVPVCATLVVDNATVAWGGPWVSWSFGGIVGCVDRYSVLDCGSVTVSTTSNVGNGAGIAGETWVGTIRLHGTTDFTNLLLDASAKVGQIAITSTKSPSLIFADGSGSDSGWTFKRSAAVEVDDLGGSGSSKQSVLGQNEVVRLGSALSSGLIKLDDTTHQPRFWPSVSSNVTASMDDKGEHPWGNQLTYSSQSVTVASADEFACLALTIQTRGYFSGVNGIGDTNVLSKLGTSTINIAGDIDLAGTGITGLTQDAYFDSDDTSAFVFSGTLNGNNHTVTLAIGEPYGQRGDTAIDADDTSEGNGKIYYHNRLGLLGKDGGSTVNILKLAGTIRAKSDAAMAIGAYAAEKCSTGSTTFTGLEVSTTLNLYQGSKKMFAGNVYGTVKDSGSITFASDCMVNSSLSSSNKPDGSTRIGGVIGLVDDDSTTTITVSNLAVSGTMEVNGGEKDDLGVGGFIAGIEKGSTKTLNINGLSLSNLSLTYSGVKKTCGGFLGYSWANTNVTFKGSSSSAYGLTASGSTLSVTETGSNPFSLGGLVYRASGVWNVGEYAIDLSGATLSGSNIKSGSNLGLLVCVGGDDGNLNGSLYLKNTAYWGDAYKVDGLTFTDMGSFSNFDEWVYSTCASGKGIADCGTNGVVSLHTNDDKLDMTGTTESRNSYVNRTSLGTSHQTNGSSRYYYNLDRAVTSATASTNSQIDTPYELLLWSVSRYADDNLTSEFAVGNANVSGPTITGTLDMTGYSYYPVDVTGESVTVKDATITFCNSAIEAEENSNKVTSSATQHMNMHAGLLRNFSCGTSSASYAVSGVTLKGSVGMDVSTSASGALLSGSMTGTSTSQAIASLSINNLTLDGLTVRGVTTSTSLAPLVACNLGTYTALNVNGIATSNYVSGTTAATSLFGNLGGESADQVTASFINVAMPSLKTESGGDAIFTHASLLESYSYAQNGASSATYTFTKSDQDGSKVTFGSEIDSSGEYSGKQLWYYDESTYETAAGLVTDSASRKADKDDPKYGVYLPYVKTGKSGTTYHEIKVNQRLANLTVGCGTYGDPFAIKTAGQLYAVANYINTRSAQDDWVVTITANQETICTRRADDGTTDNEVTYQYSSSDATWHKVTCSNNTWITATGDDAETLDNDTMHRYIQSCYLSIETDNLTVDSSSFSGLGTHDYPFRGVIVGNLVSDSSSYATLEINNATNTGIQGLITYSYGSVVRDLNVRYTGEANTIAYKAKTTEDGVPTAFFGGVIGCIMGGDNIIDGVAVSADSGTTSTTSADSGASETSESTEAGENVLTALWSSLTSALTGSATSDDESASDSSTGFSVSAGGEKPHLVAIGGYVGAIAGGGVIFRNTTGTSWHSSGDNLYDNPYVGRVIDGFAFSEGCTVDNGDDNYKVNKLKDAGAACVTTSNIEKKYRTEVNSAATVTVNNAQGLLVLSAIISSGAAAGAAHTGYTGDGYGVFYGSRAYQGWNQSDAYHKESGYSFGNDAYGKVRNATYEYVGNPAASSDDFVVSKNDDTMAPGTQSWGGALDSGFISSGTVNSPYLVASYANKETGYVCVSKLTGIDLRFVGSESYDMTGYGTGFTGLSGRYYSNACYSGDKATDRERIIPRFACINGNSAMLTLSSKVKEYKDDDYAVAGVGGLFSTVTFTSDSVSDSIAANGASVKGITFKNCNVSLTYLDSSNNAISDYAKSNTGVGILAGVTANANSQESYGVYKNVTITADSDKTTTVSGGENVGGLIGSAGYAQRSSSDSVDEIVSFSGVTTPIKLYDCSYSNLAVTGRSNVGGFVGKIASGESGVWATGTSDLALASSSTIAIDSSSTESSNTAGGIFGLVGCSVNVNTGQDSSASQLAVMSDVKVKTECAASSDDGCTRGVGSIVGRAENAVSVNRLKVTAAVEASSDNPIFLGSTNTAQNASTSTAAKNVGGIVGWANRNVTVANSTVENIRIGSGEHAGGVIGKLDSNYILTVDGTQVNALVFDGARMGGIVGIVNNSGANVVVSNSMIQNCTFSNVLSYWASHEENGNFSGGIVGYALGTYKLSNILLSENNFADTTKRQGLLVGCTPQNTNDFQGLYAAGIDVKLASGQTNDNVPAAIHCFLSSHEATINQKSYIAFADYADDFYGTSGLYGATGVSPYVTTSPKSSVAVDSGALFGDGAAITTAETIQKQAGTKVDGRYTYTNIGGIGSDGAYQNTNAYDPSTSASTFKANNTNIAVATDFPVLLLSGNDTTTVTNYLNLVTNGGFSDAVRLNGSTTHVSASVQTVKLSDDGLFVADSTATPTISVVNDGKSTMFFRATSQWDNEKGQFSLLTVIFSEAGQEYKVQVPIIVKRMLEVDFTATYSYGTHFTPTDYASLGANAHVLSNFGEPMTGYLTWTYNQAKGTATEYGWDTHLASGGSMGALDKSIVFGGDNASLPVGTQLTLVDTASNDKAYHYAVGKGGASSVKLANFKDSQGDAYSEQWLSELMGVSATTDNSGAWVECDASDSNVGSKVVTGNGPKYYRPYVEGTDSGQRYTLSVAKNDGKEISPSENFYLVVNVPSGSTASAVNGYTSASFDDTSINKNLTCTLRTDNTLDNHQNSASTYSIYSSYTQTLVDSTEKSGTNELTKTSDGTGHTFPLAATDTIIFDSAQQYNNSDKLYYQFGASLVSYVKSGDAASSSGASGFPTGTTGTLNFYVKVGETYYVPSGSGDSTTWSSAADGTVAATKVWSADGSDLAAYLADDSGILYDLSGLRTKAKDSDSSIQVIAQINDLKMTEEAAKQAIATSQDGSSYTKIHYRSALSTRTDTLSTSNMVASAQGTPGYYRKDLGSSTIELTASKQTQLGINIDDLDLSDGTIGAVGTYSLLKLVDGDSVINKASSVKYTLTLQQRTNSNGTYSGVNIVDYLTVKSSDLGTGTTAVDNSSIVFTDDSLKTRDGDSNVFKFLFNVKVNTNVETAQHFYANYRIVLTAQLLDANGNAIDTPANVNSDSSYANADYITYSLTRINTDGISH